jgi:predicted RNase H-like nuclease
VSEWIAGVDGCKGGWAVAHAPHNDLKSHRFLTLPDFKSILEFRPFLSIIMVDIPIGLTEGDPRQCDMEARDILEWPRRNSVFPAPIRSALKALDYQEAQRLTKERHPRGSGISRQSFGIFAKVKEVDDLMSPALQDRVIETHPEVIFWALNNKKAMKHSKKKKPGFDERFAILGRLMPGIPEVVEDHRGIKDDVIDAYAALWTAFQYKQGRWRRIPDSPVLDAEKLRMEMVFPK